MPDGQPAVAKFEEHEEAAHEKRNWVRLTSMCNNKCTFCLDTMAHNGTMAGDDEVKTRIIEGRRNGATRLILSGGEPTIHPNFVKYVKYGQLAGYRRIQTVTNGRMFSYPDYLKRCLDAGLGEITFSIHGHNAKVHDALVGVKGAFDEEVSALALALEDGRPIVNIDVCLNKGNIRHLPELLDRFIAMGVGEFDLLHLIPFGNAWDEKHRDRLVYDIEEAAPYIQVALEYSERPDIHIWFNRFPPPYLENYEYLIQEPYKLHDEARGRYEDYELWLTHGRPLICRSEERCSRCYLQSFCDTLQGTMDAIADDAFDAYRVRADQRDRDVEPPASYPYRWLVGSKWSELEALAFADPEARLIIELDDYTDMADWPEAVLAKVERVIVRSGAQLHTLLQLAGDMDLHVYLNRDTSAYLLANQEQDLSKVSLGLDHYSKASQSAQNLPDLRGFFQAFGPTLPTERISACISGREPRTELRVLDASMLRPKEAVRPSLTPGDTGSGRSILRILDDISTGDPARDTFMQDYDLWGEDGARDPIEKGVMDIFGYAQHYIAEHYRTKSLRCGGCQHEQGCRGMHINHVRAHGYSLMQPVPIGKGDGVEG